MKTKLAPLLWLILAATGSAQVYQPPSLSSIDPIFRTGAQFNVSLNYNRGSVNSPPQITLHYVGSATFSRSGFSTLNTGSLQIPIPAPLAGTFQLSSIELSDSGGNTIYNRDGSIARVLYSASILPVTHTLNLSAGDFSTGGPLPTTTAPGRLINISTSGVVAPGAPLTAGFIISGSGKTVLIRAAGPSLAQFGVDSPLSDPQLVLMNSTGQIIASNDNWGAAGPTVANSFASVGAFAFTASTSKDSAIVMALQSGSYTAQITPSESTAGSKTGLALVEVYELP